MSDFGQIRMLYIGSSGVSGNGLDKRRALTELGVRLESIDTKPYGEMGIRPLRSLAHRYNVGLPIERLNRDILERAATLEGITHVWVDKGQWIRPETLRALRERTGAVFVHYANDAHLVANRSRHFVASIPLYDFHFTTKRFELDEFRANGARHVELVFDAVDLQRFRPLVPSPEQQRAFGSDVTFIGRCERHYAEVLKAVADAGIGLGVWGPGWPRFARWHTWARACVRADGVFFDDYPVALSAARICLGLLSKRFPETVTTRSYEIPACGTLLLAERTEDHRTLYEEGVEAEFFGSTEELVSKIRRLLDDADECDRIAAAGHERVTRSGYDRRSRFRGMLETVVRDG